MNDDEALHGYGLSPEDHALLRGMPPAQALDWCAAAIGDGAVVTDVAALQGGTSSAVHAVSVRDRGGRLHACVLRRYVRLEWLAEEPDVPAREAAALRLLEAYEMPVPRLVAADIGGTVVDAPAILMTRLAGAIEWRPSNVEDYLRKLAEALPGIHAIAVPPGLLPPYAPYTVTHRQPPVWARDPRVWSRAIALLDEPPPEAPEGLIHRDFHPGNVLWDGGVISGVIDWPNSSRGVPEADVGHCRVNLAGALGREAADRFLEIHQSITGRRAYHPYWDISAAIGGMDADIDAHPSPEDDQFLARAVARLG